MLSLLRSLPTGVTRRPTSTTLLPLRRAAFPPSAPTNPLPRTFTTARALLARQQDKKKPAKAGGKPPPKKLDAAATRALARERRARAAAKLDPKVSGMMKFLYAPTQTAAPLRMARQRHLRHWTIHRAWQLFRRRREEAREREMMRMTQSMAEACEKLRNLAGPGTRPKGWLFRKAMAKEGVWRQDAVPIEYARPLVETPGERPWNHEWKRS